MDKKKQNILICIISIIGVAIILLMLHFADKNRVLGEDDNSYQISLKVYYVDDELVIDDQLTFNENETLLELMERTYELETKKDSVGTIVLSIDSYTTDFTTSYFSLYINGTYSSIGAKDILLTGGLNVEWKWKKV
jgi:hypothetical protein